MPYTDYDLLTQTAVGIREVGWRGQILSVSYGGGYGDDVLVGGTKGIHRWRLGFGVLPSSGLSTISSKSWFLYYWDFFQDHTVGERIFRITWEGLQWTAVFADSSLSLARFKDNIYQGELEVIQRQARDVTYNADGSVVT